MILFRVYFSLHWFRDIYRRYFLRNIQRDIFNLPLEILNIPIIFVADYKDKIGNYTKYLEKKSNWVGAQISEDYMKISQVRYGVAKFPQVACGVVKFSLLDLAGAKFSHLPLAVAKFIFSLVQLSSNGHNFFISAPICTPFKALDSWFPDLRKNI